MLVVGFLQDAFHEQTPQVMKGLKTALKSVPPSPATGSAICRSFDVVAAGQPKVSIRVIFVSIRWRLVFV